MNVGQLAFKGNLSSRLKFNPCLVLFFLLYLAMN